MGAPGGAAAARRGGRAGKCLGAISWGGRSDGIIRPNGSASAGICASRQGRRPSKYDQVIARWREASQRAPLSIDDMVQAAADAGSPIPRNTVRSMVFNNKKAGRVQPVGDRYVWLQEKSPPAGQAEELL